MQRKITFAQVAVLTTGILTLVTPKFLGLARLVTRLHYSVATRVERFRYILYHDLKNATAAEVLRCAIEATSYYSPQIPERRDGRWE